MENQRNYLSVPQFYGVNEMFYEGLQKAIHGINDQRGIFAADNFIAIHRNLSFLDNQKLMDAVKRHSECPEESAIIWRIFVQLWAIHNGLHLEGDFVECACYKGITARILCDTIDFEKYPDKKYYLYDLFEHSNDMIHHALPEHSSTLFEEVKNRFSNYSNVEVIKGFVPDILLEKAPEKIAFMNLDLNNAPAEIAALDILFDRMVPGAILVLDDYGWLWYRAQKEAEDPWFLERGYHVLELPTGQGLVIKR